VSFYGCLDLPLMLYRGLPDYGPYAKSSELSPPLSGASDIRCAMVNEYTP